MNPVSKYLADSINLLPEEQREEILKCFCKDCHVYLGDNTDWSGSNYCTHCSPDPAE